MKIALLGGTFNPVHNGHLRLAEEVKNKFQYDKIYFVPSCIPAHKSINDAISPVQRFEMLQIALDNLDWADISNCEIERKGYSFTIDTLEYFYKNYLFTGKPGLVIGDDLAEGFYSWKDPEKIIQIANLIVAHRLFKEDISLTFSHQYIDNSIFNLSSSEIRDKYKMGEDIVSFIPAGVLSYIKNKGLYLGEKS
ncbi:MAG: nicotinate (nicotinamide) nucleotide adenylyltransferase [bacterium]|nr:nicotinate (nicotinamide) nucleotide adenylyltransferase [bacterium]